MKKLWSGGILLTVALLSFLACVTNSRLDELAQFEPVPALSPLEVILIQLEALRHNDESNRGMKIAFRFASPENRRASGPVENFIRIMESESFNAMLDPAATQFLPPKFDERVYMQPVRLVAKDGRVLIYLFFLKKQSAPPYGGCWMIEGVHLFIPKERQPGEVPPLKELDSPAGNLEV